MPWALEPHANACREGTYFKNFAISPSHVAVSCADCTQAISYSRFDLLTSMLPVWHELLREDGEPGSVDPGSPRLDCCSGWRVWLGVSECDGFFTV